MPSYSPDETYALADLQHWNFPGASLAVVGYPVRHSISPAMHNAALGEMAETNETFRNWRYFRFEIPPEELLEALPLFHQAGFRGLNLTVPHKEIAVSGVVRIDPSAKRIGAVNTLLREENGYAGFNTDGYGLETGIQLELQRSLEASSIALIGAGGAGRAAAFQCIERRCAHLAIINRNQDRLQRVASELASLAAEKAVALSAHAPADELDLPPKTLFINATSLGLKADDPLPIPQEAFRSEDCLYDMIYTKPQTPLMDAAARQGCQVANGLAMLVHQGARSLGIWTEADVPAAAMNRAAQRAVL